LPSEAEWEYAAAGPERREFPWGADFNPDCANSAESNVRMVTPVGTFPAGASRVSEWYRGGVEVDDDLRRILGCDYQVCRGGSFTRYADLTRCRRRHGPYPSSLYPIGFRLAESLTENHDLKGERQ